METLIAEQTQIVYGQSANAFAHLEPIPLDEVEQQRQAFEWHESFN